MFVDEFYLLVKCNLFPNIGKDSTVSVFTEKKKVWAAKGMKTPENPSAAR
jgi:hypothetical protein